MLHIAVVDDEQEQRSLLEELLHRFERENGQSFGISQFGDAGEFLRQDPGVFDIVLLDIQMPGLDGMSVARQLREKNRHLVLIFITNMAQFAIEGYAVDAMDFILKPVSYYRLAASLTKARSRLLTEQGVPLLLHTKDGTYRLDSARVHYIEMLNHHTIFHTIDGIFDTTGSLKKLEEQLTGQSFARCNNGYLVNLRYVRGVEGSDVVVGDDRLQQMLIQSEEQYRIRKESMELLNIKHHDLKHQLGLLRKVVDEKALQGMEEAVNRYDTIARTGNESLDLVLSEKSMLCQAKQITFSYIADGARLNHMEAADIYTLFGNATDNAIEYLQKLSDPEKRFLHLSVKRQGTMVSIHVENYYEGPALSGDAALPRTTKENKSYHGFGLRSIQMTAEKYGGEMSVHTRDHLFCLDVVLPCPPDPA